MLCQTCGSKTGVLDTNDMTYHDCPARYRRIRCTECGKRYTTYQLFDFDLEILLEDLPDLRRKLKQIRAITE